MVRRRSRGRKGKGRIVGRTKYGEPICIKNGKLVIGKQCLTMGEDKEGNIKIEYHPDRCEGRIRDYIDGLVGRTVMRGGKTVYERSAGGPLPELFKKRKGK
mgnify:CR=1 FL=1